MADRPITILPPTLEHVLDGACTRLRRPTGTLSRLSIGDHLWLREQFYLSRQFDFTGPLVAMSRGAVPVYATDRQFLPSFACEDLGRRRFARELPKAWHRAHLQILHFDAQPLHAITDEDIAAEGHESRDLYARAWDAGVSLSSRGDQWRENPTVLVITFRAIAAPLSLQQESLAS